MLIDNSDTEVLKACIGWLQQGHGVELVTVARTWGSSPRPPGSLAAVRDDGVIVGSVSGGCVEKQLSESFRGARRARVFSHRVDDEQARRFGLACGGNLELVFETLTDPAPLAELLARLVDRERLLRCVDVSGGPPTIATAARGDGFHYDGVRLQKIFGPGWRLLLIGAGQLSRYTAEFALALDYEVMVCEPREQFRSAWAVPGTTLLDAMPDDAVRLHASDPQSAVLALSHDAGLDDLALQEALPSSAFHVGALGSGHNRHRRDRRLAFLGLDEADIRRLHGPVGLPIGSRSSAEIAVSIVAQLIQVRAALALAAVPSPVSTQA